MENNKIVRIYCSGVFDLFHIGHMNFIEKIYNHCNLLFDNFIIIVGIHSDNTCKTYKREPILNENIRYKTVTYCKYINEIITDAPLEITSHFIINNSIDYVAISDEYIGTEKNILFHKGALELNKYFYIERYKDISTSEIINKCKNY